METIQYRTKLSHALSITILFAFLTLLFLFVGLNVQSFSSDSYPYVFLIVLFSIGAIFKNPGDKKWLQVSVVLIAVAVLILAIILLGGVVFLILGVCLTGAFGAYYAWVNLITRQPIIEATPTLLMLNNFFYKGRYYEIPWTEVQGLSLKSVYINGKKLQYLVVKLVDPERFKQENSSFKKVMKQNETLYDGQFTADASHLDASEQDILARLNGFVNKASNKVATVL